MAICLQNKNDISDERRGVFLWWSETIARKIFIENINLPSLEKDDTLSFSDWGIDEEIL